MPHRFRQYAVTLTAPGLSLLLAGCGLTSSVQTPSVPAPQGMHVSGAVHGGQQPVAGATIGMYTAGTTGYASPATSVLNPGITITTDAGGNFNLDGKYTCTPEQRLYLTASGGDAGSGFNSAIRAMAAFGRCGDLGASTFIVINEVSTAASVTALAPFMAGPVNLGAPASNQVGLNNAFDDVRLLTNLGSGTSPGTGLATGTTVPVGTIYGFADVLAACINSTGPASTACSTLFGYSSQPDANDPNAPQNGSASLPSETLTAAMDIAQHPSRNVARLTALISPSAPFQPTLASYPDFTLAVTFSGGFNKPSAVAIDGAGNAWVTDSGANSVTVLSHTGVPQFTNASLLAPVSVAIDQAGNGWVANSGNSTLTRVTPGNSASSYAGGGLNLPKSVAIDGQGNVWVANAGNGTASEFSPAGVALSPAGGYVSPGGTPIGVALDPN